MFIMFTNVIIFGTFAACQGESGGQTLRWSYLAARARA